MTDNISISWNLKENPKDTRSSEEKWRELEEVNVLWALSLGKLSTQKKETNKT